MADYQALQCLQQEVVTIYLNKQETVIYTCTETRKSQPSKHNVKGIAKDNFVNDKIRKNLSIVIALNHL